MGNERKLRSHLITGESKMETGYSGTFDAVLQAFYPNFDPRRPSPKERELYVSAFLDWVKFDDLERVPRYLETLSANEPCTVASP